MGRKRRRKQERQLERRRRRASRRPDWFAAVEPTPEELAAIAIEQEARTAAFRAPVEPRCGGCGEFVENEMTMRGSCLHPGSGIAFPWSDTPGCDFFQPLRSFERRR